MLVPPKGDARFSRSPTASPSIRASSTPMTTPLESKRTDRSTMVPEMPGDLLFVVRVHTANHDALDTVLGPHQRLGIDERRDRHDAGHPLHLLPQRIAGWPGSGSGAYEYWATTTCGVAPRIRSRSSLWKPFSTESTMMIAATPTNTPPMAMAVMPEIARLPLPRRYRRAMKSSNLMRREPESSPQRTTQDTKFRS